MQEFLIDSDKDVTIDNLIPNNLCECSLGVNSAVCSRPETIHAISEAIGAKVKNEEKIIDIAKSKLNCRTEAQVLVKLAPIIGKDEVEKELQERFKLPGPTDNSLLNSANIDSILAQWTHLFEGFFAYNFNMRDFKKYSIKNNIIVNSPDTLETIPFASLYEKGTKCAACVINSDCYHGPGKHWMALFVDARQVPATIEFFNSSGNAPAPEWVEWMIKTKDDLDATNGPIKKRTGAKIVRVTNMRHQHSATECGVYSLFYIWARLNGTSYKYFAEHMIKDKYMFEFRQHLFLSEENKNVKHFDWEEYKRKVPIKWAK
jgi:hypothetical protein